MIRTAQSIVADPAGGFWGWYLSHFFLTNNKILLGKSEKLCRKLAWNPTLFFPREVFSLGPKYTMTLHAMQREITY